MLDIDLAVYRSIFLHTKLDFLGEDPSLHSWKESAKLAKVYVHGRFGVELDVLNLVQKTGETYAAVSENDARDKIAGRDRNCGWMMENHALENGESTCMSD